MVELHTLLNCASLWFVFFIFILKDSDEQGKLLLINFKSCYTATRTKTSKGLVERGEVDTTSLPWLQPSMDVTYWDEESNQRKYLDWLACKLNITTPSGFILNTNNTI